MLSKPIEDNSDNHVAEIRNKPNDLKLYRQICFLPLIWTMLEMLLHKHLLPTLEKNHLIASVAEYDIKKYITWSVLSAVKFVPEGQTFQC